MCSFSVRLQPGRGKTASGAAVALRNHVHRCVNTCVSLPGFRPNLLAMKVRDLLRLLADDEWYLARTRGSHQHFRHPTKLGLVTVAGQPGDDLAPGTLNSILKQAGLKS